MPFKKGHRGRGRPAKSQGTTRTSTPAATHDASDEEMVDVEEAGADADETHDGDRALPDDGEDEDEAATPAQDEEDPDGPPTVTTIPTRRRRGRGGARQSLRADFNSPDPGDEASESGTPFKRRRGRPAGSGTGRGGFRGRRRGAPPEAPHVMVDGQKIDVLDDEAQLDDDAEGDEKVDGHGSLHGGRQYRVRTFKIIGRGERLYMLSTEPARCCGFRDSYLFFAKHPKLYKLLLSDAEKKDLIDRDILPNSYKGRNIGVVTARSVFREFGPRIIVGGRRVTDDYKVAEARANGAVEGELADPEDRVPGKDEEYNRNRYVAWFGASDVYRSQAGAGQGPEKKGVMVGKRRNNVTISNWQFVHAREASRFNSGLAAARHANQNGVYDHNTNIMFHPTITQPTHARWQQIPPPPAPITSGQRPLTNGARPSSSEPTEPTDADTIFHPVPAVVSRNFTVVDVAFASPPISNVGFPGPDGVITDPTSGGAGLSAVPAELLDELPASCRVAFEEARAAELRWKRQWATERSGALRGDLKVGFVGYPV